MFPSRYFPPRFFAPRYWERPTAVLVVQVPGCITVTLSSSQIYVAVTLALSDPGTALLSDLLKGKAVIGDVRCG